MADPELFGRYRVVKRIGSGAFASVWLAHDDVLDGPVAVKVLADNWAGRADVRERFVEEARMLRRADSDRVVRVHDIGDLPDGRPYFVMTYADSGTLADRLTGVPMSPPEALWFAVETARAVAVLHGRGIIHRDIKPSNVLLRAGHDGQEVLVSDLGLAKAAIAASGMTLAAGTPGYMPPEQAEGFGLTFASDVYALAALTYRLLAGETPRRADSPVSVLNRSAEPVRPVGHYRSDLPPGVDAVLQRGLEPDPVDRYPDARAFGRALVDVAGALPARPGSTIGGSSARRPAARSPARPADRRPTAPEVPAPAGADQTVLMRAARPAPGRDDRARDRDDRAPDRDDRDDPAQARAAVPDRRAVGLAAAAAPDSVPVGAGVGSRTAVSAPTAVEPPTSVGPGPAVADRFLDLPAPSEASPTPVRRPRRHPGRVLGLILLTLAVLAAAATLAGVLEPGLRDRAFAVARGDRFVESGGLAMSVPAGWAGRYSAGAQRVTGLPMGTALTVSNQPARFADRADTGPGAAVVVWPGDVVRTVRPLAARAGCSSQQVRGRTVGGFPGTVTRWTNCPGGGPDRWDDFLGTRAGRTLFVQVKSATSSGEADAVLDSVRVQAAAAGGR